MTEPKDVQMTDILVERLRAIEPLLEGLETGQDCEEYAYAKGKGFEAMTYCPEAFEALRSVPEAADRIIALEAELKTVLDREADTHQPRKETQS